MSADISGVSRSGRVRKKSAKLIEMEEMESETNGSTPKRSAGSSLLMSPTSTLLNEDRPLKKKLKIKFSSDNGHAVEEMPIENDVECELLENSHHDNFQSVPSLKIKLFHNNNDNFSTSPKKAPKMSISKAENSLLRAPVHDKSAANLLFQQITSGQVVDNRRNRNAKKRFSDMYENVVFGSDASEDEHSLVICDSSESLAAAMEKAKAAKNPPKPPAEQIRLMPGKNLKKGELLLNGTDKKKRPPAVTAYTMFARENRHRIQQSYPNLDFANISKRLGEVWQSLPPREKMQWKRKAQKHKNQAQHVQPPPRVRTIAALRPKPPITEQIKITEFPPPLSQQQMDQSLKEQSRDLSACAIDVASYFRMLGNSFSMMGAKFSDKSVDMSPSASLCYILDSTLCSMSALLCLTNHTELTNACDPNTQRQLLENISHIMPGVQS